MNKIFEKKNKFFIENKIMQYTYVTHEHKKPHQSDGEIQKLVCASKDHKILCELLLKYKLFQLLESLKDIIIFAPEDKAFQEPNFNHAIKNLSHHQLKNLLTYHVALKNKDPFRSSTYYACSLLKNESLLITENKFVNNIPILHTIEIPKKNITVYILPKVLMPIKSDCNKSKHP